MNILIAGGTGFLGRALTDALLSLKPVERPIQVVWLSRKHKHRNIPESVKVITYNDLTDNLRFDVVVNLAGESVVESCWSDQRKTQLLHSRVWPTETLVNWMATLTVKPRLFMSSSAIGWYGARGNAVLDERSEPQEEFQHQLCREWEKASLKATQHGIRTCIFRTGVVLHPSNGMLAKMLPVFKLGLGGKLGSGEQILSWVSLQDWVNALLFLMQEDHVQDAQPTGNVFNITAPNPVSNLEFTQVLAKALRRPAWFTVPAVFLRLGFGEMSTLLLQGQYVLPIALMDKGYHFAHATLQEALQSQLKK